MVLQCPRFTRSPPPRAGDSPRPEIPQNAHLSPAEALAVDGSLPAVTQPVLPDETHVHRLLEYPANAVPPEGHLYHAGRPDLPDLNGLELLKGALHHHPAPIPGDFCGDYPGFLYTHRRLARTVPLACLSPR